ncbi:MAG TPA: ATP-binding protein, partial [Geobacteraceae bacterium]
LLVTLLIVLTGGISSPYSFLYILSIINASFLLARREAIYTASLCGILYGALVDLQYYGKLEALGLHSLSAQQYGATHILYTIFINIVSFYLTAFVTGYLAERAITSETALHEKAINYEELERLNSLIVTNLNSGLITVNNVGRIRVFNRYASELTGISLEEAYDQPLEEVVPVFRNVVRATFTPYRGEVAYESPKGNLIFGVNSVPFTDRDGNREGGLINFQDLTQFKRMEAELKKADRLAAIGELSARIAHEVRNPLASISGSVQLIAQGETVAAKDKKLLQIVMRETDRLNGLISEFLAYARPVQPMKSTVRFHQFMTDLTDLLKSDQRFEKVAISIACPQDLAIEADRNQLQQVFWNLAVNAAEAMPGGGEVSIVCSVVNADYTGVELGDMTKVEVKDNGCGMTGENVSKVFEPFFTTKQGGTGLGLAIVYRIVEAHGGVIFVDSVRGEGTRFTMFLPLQTTSD